MSLTRRQAGFCLLVLFAAADAAQAHTGVGVAHGFANGFLHPLSGIDHVLAMVAVGMLAARLGGRALWMVPASFVVMMIVGGALGMTGVGLPPVEIAIGLSVIVLGLIVAFQLDMATWIAMAVVGLFALFHGHSHGTEMPQNTSALDYGAGFVLATALLHATGICLGIEAGRQPRALRVLGSAMAVAGVAIICGNV
jgi:urease accessory protein